MSVIASATLRRSPWHPCTHAVAVCAGCITQRWTIAADSTTATLALAYTGHTAAVTALALRSDGFIASGAQDGVIRVWNAASGASVLQMSITPAAPRAGGVNSMIMIPATVLWPERLIAAYSDYYIRIWDPVLGGLDPLKILSGHTDAVLSIGLLPDMSIISAAADGMLAAWNPDTGFMWNTLVQVG